MANNAGAATTTATTSTPTATTAAPSQAGPLEFADRAFLGISQGSLMTEAAQAFGIAPVRASTVDVPSTVGACTGTPDPWVILAGGLTMFFEDPAGAADTAALTNWNYTGAAVGGFTGMVTPGGITVGSTRQDVAAAYPDALGLDDDEIFVNDPITVRFGLSGDSVVWFGVIDCVLEGEEPLDNGIPPIT